MSHITQTADQLNKAFARYFPANCGVRIIAEPGRFFVSSAFTVVCNITSVRCVTSENSNEKNTHKEVRLSFFAFLSRVRLTGFVQHLKPFEICQCLPQSSINIELLENVYFSP